MRVWQEVIILVGSPGSGKSSLAKAVFVSQGYVYVNQDTLKSREKCLEKLVDGEGIVSVPSIFERMCADYFDRMFVERMCAEYSTS